MVRQVPGPIRDDLVMAVLRTPHLATTGEDIPDLLDRLVANRPRRRSGRELEMGRTLRPPGRAGRARRSRRARRRSGALGASSWQSGSFVAPPSGATFAAPSSDTAGGASPRPSRGPPAPRSGGRWPNEHRLTLMADRRSSVDRHRPITHPGDAKQSIKRVRTRRQHRREPPYRSTGARSAVSPESIRFDARLRRVPGTSMRRVARGSRNGPFMRRLPRRRSMPDTGRHGAQYDGIRRR